MVMNSKSYKSQRSIFNKASLLVILNLVAYSVLLIFTWYLLSALSKGPFTVFIINYFQRQGLASVLRIMFVLVTAPLPLLGFYASIYNQVSNSYNYRMVWSLVGMVITQNYRKDARFILAPTLYIAACVLFGSFGLIAIDLLANNSSWGYTPLIIMFIMLALLLLADIFKKVIIQEIRKTR